MKKDVLTKTKAEENLKNFRIFEIFSRTEDEKDYHVLLGFEFINDKVNYYEIIREEGTQYAYSVMYGNTISNKEYIGKLLKQYENLSISNDSALYTYKKLKITDDFKEKKLFIKIITDYHNELNNNSNLENNEDNGVTM